jgi:putative thiamine transport system ATP-binding protein
MSGVGPGLLRLERVAIDLGERALIPPLDVAIAAGECVTVMGPSGCGKSTLLALVSGTLDAAFRATGRVWIGDDDVTQLPPEARRIGIQFQDDLLFPHLSVAENLLFALAPGVTGRSRRRERVAQALAEAATLSGGQRARVALMRTLLAEPRALLLDEPFNRLDAQLRGDFRRFVFEHAARRGLPMLLVTHDPADVPAGGRVLALPG